MSKERNYIIILGGVLVMIAVIVFGVIKHFLYPVAEIEPPQQAINFLTFVIPSLFLTGLTMSSIANLIEKKELKAVTKLNTEYSTKFIIKLESIETAVLAIRQSEIDREEESLEKEKEHLEVHKKMDSKFKELKSKIDKHIENHN